MLFRLKTNINLTKNYVFYFINVNYMVIVHGQQLEYNLGKDETGDLSRADTV